MIVLDVNSIIVYVACIIFLFLIGRFFIIPLKSIAKIIGNSILGGILIFIINAIGSIFNFHIGLNIGTAIITGILGVPRSNFAYTFKNIYRVILKMKTIDFFINLLFFKYYSTVTDFAKFLGLSTSKLFSFEI